MGGAGEPEALWFNIASREESVLGQAAACRVRFCIAQMVRDNAVDDANLEFEVGSSKEYETE